MFLVHLTETAYTITKDMPSTKYLHKSDTERFQQDHNKIMN